MIIGNGDIATKLIDNNLDREDILFFAAGISNSKEKREMEYYREIRLMENKWHNNNQMHFVYFSSLCIYYSNSRYAKHKLDMEKFIQYNFKRWTIIRLGNITWGNNPNTIINYFKEMYSKATAPNIEDAYRHLVSEEEFIYWIKKIRPGERDIMNIPGRLLKVEDIWKEVKAGKL